MSETMLSPEEVAQEVRRLAMQLQQAGRKDLLLHAIGVPLLEELRIEAAKGRLSRLVITEDYRFILEDYHKEVELQPVHKAVYLLFLAHPEGIEFKRLADYREVGFCVHRMIAPATAISVSIMIVRVAPEMASRTFPASVNREMISPTLRVPKKFIGRSITCR